jgi:hypothetical protein
MTSPITLTFAAQIYAIEQIRRTFAERLRCMDNNRWEIYPTLHTDDVVSETWDGVPKNNMWTPADGQSNRVVGKVRLTQAIS